MTQLVFFFSADPLSCSLLSHSDLYLCALNRSSSYYSLSCHFDSAPDPFLAQRLLFFARATWASAAIFCCAFCPVSRFNSSMFVQFPTSISEANLESTHAPLQLSLGASAPRDKKSQPDSSTERTQRHSRPALLPDQNRRTAIRKNDSLTCPLLTQICFKTQFDEKRAHQTKKTGCKKVQSRTRLVNRRNQKIQK